MNQATISLVVLDNSLDLVGRDVNALLDGDVSGVRSRHEAGLGQGVLQGEQLVLNNKTHC